MTNTASTQQKWTIFRFLGLALIGAGAFHLMASLSTSQPEFPLGALLTLHWELVATNLDGQADSRQALV